MYLIKLINFMIVPTNKKFRKLMQRKFIMEKFEK